MKLFIKLVLLTNIIVLASFAFFNAKAASIQDDQVLVQQKSQIMIFFTLPQLKGEGSNAELPNTLISAISDKSQHYSIDKHTCPSKKANEIYELTALFNDKLQVLLSYFSTHEQKLNLEDKREDKEAIKVLSVKTS
ncbi:hypothetical protein [Thalassotalea piscium]|uniref:Uncharacterized protein n=1 Tax=Thalassotalea piscium TaxID=1230533 RepID=A0A7X0NHI4_9GAMM|nr:hypothetical protein [Thalassotalea piscium]MBB6543565.1 hypothetical protein [Thalassotalea piscium]